MKIGYTIQFRLKGEDKKYILGHEEAILLMIAIPSPDQDREIEIDTPRDMKIAKKLQKKGLVKIRDDIFMSLTEEGLEVAKYLATFLKYNPFYSIVNIANTYG